MERLRELGFLKRMPNTEKPAYFEVRRIQNDRVGQRIHQIEQDIYVGAGPAARNKEYYPLQLIRCHSFSMSLGDASSTSESGIPPQSDGMP